ncbi:MAG: hypothetical protein AB8G96_05275 [Phycisphaerales bacterium]
MREDVAILIGASGKLDEVRRKLCGLGWQAVQPCYSLVGIRRFLVEFDGVPKVMVVAAGTDLSPSDRAMLEPVLADSVAHRGLSGTIGLGRLDELAELGCDVYTLDVDEAVRLAESYSATVCRRSSNGRFSNRTSDEFGDRFTSRIDGASRFSSDAETRASADGDVHAGSDGVKADEPVDAAAPDDSEESSKPARRMTWLDGIPGEGSE